MYQLQYLNFTSICELLRKMMKRSSTEDITVTHSDHLHLDNSWFVNLWQYISQQDDKKLYILEGLPILPITLDPRNVVELKTPSLVFSTTTTDRGGFTMRQMRQAPRAPTT